MGIIDNIKFRQAGAIDCNSDFRLHRTSCCAIPCVEDHELGRLYIDSNDLARMVSLLRTPDEPEITCPFCKSYSWNLIEVLEVNEVPTEWKWACFEK